MSLIAASPLTAFEQERLDRIAENRRRMEEMGVLDTARDLLKSFRPAKPPTQRRTVPKERKPKRHQPVRRSRRLTGAGAEFGSQEDSNDECVTYSDLEPGLDDILADGGDIESMPEEKQVQFQEMRCGSMGRGSVYDSVAGITCHFCRQKKLCGEDGCPRCSRRSTTADCIGKTDCSRCHGATGRFCRACLLIRYGQTMEDARKEMDAGTWLCPHCYEDEHPEEGWMCNSSICMKRRGYKPTGIAIYDAQQRGFPSVAHWLQAQLRKRGGSSGKEAGAAAAAAGDKQSQADSSSGSAAAGAAAAAEVVSSKRSKKVAAAPGSSKAASSSASAEVQAPGTPVRDAVSAGVESAAAEPAAAGRGGRVTRRGAGAGFVADAEQEQSSKRVCVGEAAGTRRSLRFRGK
ncbi:hypothetical protein OEZ86_003146 [Tetradesmus obliquus]|nr:hypothetical protein OEZ86_003146 [Tetradesmus obliquus]